MQLPILQKATVRAGIRRRLRTRFHRDSCIPEVAALERGNKCCFPKVGGCPLGYYSSGGYCVPSKGSNTRGAIEKVEGSCHLEFYSSGNSCLSSPSNEREAIQKTGNSCPLGWFSSGSYCVKSR